MKFKTEVKTFRIDEQCDSCNEGQMRPTGYTLDSYPPQYPHKCTKCDHTETYHNTFPYIVTEDVEQILITPQYVNMLLAEQHFHISTLEAPCPKCDGIMYDTGEELESLPAQLEFKCPKCEHITYIVETEFK